jgi:hypothetical protein
MPVLVSDLRAVIAAAEVVRVDIAGCRTVSDDELLALISANADLAHLAATNNAVLSGEVARRSAAELGHDGLAQKLGYRTRRGCRRHHGVHWWGSEDRGSGWVIA